MGTFERNFYEYSTYADVLVLREQKKQDNGLVYVLGRIERLKKKYEYPYS